MIIVDIKVIKITSIPSKGGKVLNLEFVQVFFEFGAILAGFSMAIASSFILQERKTGEQGYGQLQRVGVPFIISSILLILGVFLAALILSVNAQVPENQNQPGPLINAADWLFRVTIAGGISMLVGMGLSGFVWSKGLGILTSVLSFCAFMVSVLIYNSLV